MPLIIDYNPPGYPLDRRAAQEFFRKYLEHLGRPRNNVKASHKGLIVEADQPGMLSLASGLLAMALAESIDNWQLEPVEELNPPGGWFGNLEPDSAGLLIERIGRPLHSPNGFHYEAPLFRKGYRLPMDAGSLIELTTEDHQDRLKFIVRGTASALLSLAKHAIYLSQGPEGAEIRYGKTEGVKDERNQFVLKRTAFDENVPWAKVPPSKT